MTLQLGQTGSVCTRTARFVLVWHATGFLSISALIVICAVVYTAILFVLKGFIASDTVLERCSHETAIMHLQNNKELSEH
jgi:hypothetical protein